MRMYALQWAKVTANLLPISFKSAKKLTLTAAGVSGPLALI